MITQVRAYYLFKHTLVICIVKLFDPFRKQSESTADIYAFGIHCLKLFGGIYHATAGAYHVVDNDDVFTVYIVPEELMCNDGIFTVYDLCVVASFIEHTGIHTENAAEIYGTVKSSLVGRDDYKVVFIDDKVSLVVDK